MATLPRSAISRTLHHTSSLCSVCKNGIEAEVVATMLDEVWMLKQCPTHGAQDVRISTDADWYTETRAIGAIDHRPSGAAPVHHGCPFDCGPCESHTQKVRLPVVTITSACNLDCPICYVHNKNDGAYHMSTAEFEQILDHLLETSKGDLDLINFTGGEPTMHPDFESFLEICARRGVHRVAICTNGIKLARDEALVQRLAGLNARIALSYDSFEEEADVLLQGARLLGVKARCLDLLEQYDLDTTLIPVMTKGVNDHEIGRMIELLIERPMIRHLEVHTMTYTGQGGVNFPRTGRISMAEVLDRIEETTDGFLRRADFVPSPCAHPLCYQIAYLLVDPDGGRPVPFTRFMPRETLYACLSDHLYLEPGPKLEAALLEAIDRLWADGSEEAERTLAILKRLLRLMFPAEGPLPHEEALRVGERACKAIYLHAHMDEETFDTERVAQCCDSSCTADGRTVPVCAYNVLYRDKEDKFMSTPLQWNERSGGRISFAPEAFDDR